MATTQELVKDPEFLGLDAASKRQVLDSVDSDFLALDENSKNQVISSLPTIGTESPATDVGGIPGIPLTRQEARQVAADRLIARSRASGQRGLISLEEANQLAAQAGIPGIKDTGQGVPVVSLDQISNPAIRAALVTKEAAGSALLGLPQAIERLVEDETMNPAQKLILSQQALRERFPEAAPAGQIIGAINPIGGTVKTAAKAPTLLKQIFQGAKIGVPLGATAGAATQLAETGTETTPGELLGATGLGATGGLVVGTAAPLAVRGLEGALSTLVNAPRRISTLAERFKKNIAPATVEESALAVLGSKSFTPKHIEQHLPVVTQRVDQVVGKIPQTTEEALSTIGQTKKKLYDDRIEVNRLGDEQGLKVKGDDALANAKDTLAAIPTITQKEREAILEELTPIFRGDKTLEQGQAIQQRLNHEFEVQYANDTFDRAAPRNEARIAVRNSFADQMDKLQQVLTGRNETPYADIGSLIEVAGALEGKLNKLKIGSAARKTGIETEAASAPATKFQAANRIKRSVLTPFQKSQLEKLDENVQKIFQQGARQPPAIPMTAEEIDALRQGFLPTPASQVQGASLQDQIAEAMKSVPPAFRGNPDVERQIAEAIARKYPQPQ